MYEGGDGGDGGAQAVDQTPDQEQLKTGESVDSAGVEDHFSAAASGKKFGAEGMDANPNGPGNPESHGEGKNSDSGKRSDNTSEKGDKSSGKDTNEKTESAYNFLASLGLSLNSEAGGNTDKANNPGSPAKGENSDSGKSSDNTSEKRDGPSDNTNKKTESSNNFLANLRQSSISQEGRNNDNSNNEGRKENSEGNSGIQSGENRSLALLNIATFLGFDIGPIIKDFGLAKSAGSGWEPEQSFENYFPDPGDTASEKEDPDKDKIKHQSGLEDWINEMKKSRETDEDLRARFQKLTSKGGL